MGFQKEGTEYCDECGSEKESGACPSCGSDANLLEEDALIIEERLEE